MADYITVVSVQNGLDQCAPQQHLADNSQMKQSKDSQFITVLAIGDENNTMPNVERSLVKNNIQQIEEIVVYRLPGERLGFGLKFQGGTKSNENIQRLFIQSCENDSPASRCTASWGHLREGDEILKIDGVDVTKMTRLECVRCLKESNLAIMLLVRNGEGKAYDFNVKENMEMTGDKKAIPPPPPPVPPRKINKRKSHEKLNTDVQNKIQINDKPFTPPPESEYYINLFAEENEFKLRESESDDTGSTISTVIDNFSINSNSDLNINIKTIPSSKSTDLAKVLKTFQLLEQEFCVENESKFDDCLIRLQPPNNFQDTTNFGSGEIDKNEKNLLMSQVYENVLINSENLSDKCNDYVNIQITTKPNEKNYANIEVSSNRTNKQYDGKIPPTPLPRQGVLTIEPRARSVAIASPIIPMPRLKTFSKPTDYQEDIHECKVVIDENGNKEDTCNLPRLINFLPKVIPSSDLIREQNNSSKAENSENIDYVDGIVIKKCIRVIRNVDDGDDDDDKNNDNNYIDSSSSDDDIEKDYEPEMIEKRDSSDTLSDEDGEKLGPPELLNTPGPSEAYFNFHWNPNMLPTIGEVEEEFSSLEPNVGPILIIDTVDDTTIDGPKDINCKSTDQPINIPSKLQLTMPTNDKNCTQNDIIDSTVVSVSFVGVKNKPAAIVEPKLETVVSQVNGKNNSIQQSVFGVISDKSVPDKFNSINQFSLIHNNNEIVENSIKKNEHQLQSKPLVNGNDDSCIGSGDSDGAKETIEKLKNIKNKNEHTISDGKDSNNKLTTRIRSKIAKLTKKSSPEKQLATKKSDSTIKMELADKSIPIKQKIILKPAKIDSTKNGKTKKDKSKPSVASLSNQNECAKQIVAEQCSNVEMNVDGLKKDFEKKVDEIHITQRIQSVHSVMDKTNGDNLFTSHNADEINQTIETNKEIPDEKIQNCIIKVEERIILGASDSTVDTIITDGLINELHLKRESTPSMEHNIAMISTPILVNDLHISPPTFSRLPPDGHEFPPNFSEPIIITPILKHNGQINSVKLAKEEKISSKDDAPPLPKTVPPSTTARKIYRQDLIITVDDSRADTIKDTNGKPSLDNGKYKKTWSPAVLEDKNVRKEIMITAKNCQVISDGTNSISGIMEIRRRSIENSEAFKKFDMPRKQIGTLPSNWRKDEKSEKSVRDKIAMFSSDDKEMANVKKPLNKSTENLLSENMPQSKRSADNSSTALTKKAQSVENLDDISRYTNFRNSYITENNLNKETTNTKQNKDSAGGQCKLKNIGKAFSVENLNNSYAINDASTIHSRKLSGNMSANVPASYASLPRSRPPSVTRTTSFSGSSSYDERRRSSINNLLEQRRKSMSKLRGLIIPEKTTIGEDSMGSVFDLPEIQNKDAQKVFQSYYTNGTSIYTNSKREPVVPNPRHYIPAYQSLASPADNNNSYKSIFSTPNTTLPSISRSSDTKAIKKLSQILPPVKPPRTSLIIAGRFSGECQRSPPDDSEDSDSVFSSKISSPPSSPITATPPEKFTLTRTLSSETNTSIASSTASTLTSGSGSQASCSSAGSTPTIDMSRKIIKSSSNESYVNRKNILALAKCRSGKDDSGRQQNRYDDEDSTDGCDEEETRRMPKTKQRIASTNVSKLNTDNDINNRPINYRLVTSADNLVDMVINVASYVEITSDTDADSKMSDSIDVKINKKFIDEERKASFKGSKERQKPSRVIATVEETSIKSQEKLCESNELAKWVRNEVARTLKNTESVKSTEKHKSITNNKTYNTPPSVAENIQKFNMNATIDLPKTPNATTQLDTKSKSRSDELRKTFELKTTNQVTNSPIKSPKNSYHERFSSLDSLASSSSGVSSTQTSFGHTNPSESFQNLQNTPTTDYGSFSSYGSNHSLITPADLQQIVEEADPPLKTPEAFVVVLQRDTPESSVGVTLAGGADYEAKEITIHRILSNSPAYKDGRLRKGDRLLSINGLSMRGLTHRESVSVLKTPRSEVVMVVTRSESLVVDDKIKRSSLGSMTSLTDKTINGLDNGTRKMYHKASRSLDIDLDRISNIESINDECKSVDGAEGSVSSSMGDEIFSINNDTNNQNIKKDGSTQNRIVEIVKDICGLGLAIEGGLDSPLGHKPLSVKKVFMGGAAEKTGKVCVGDIILSINDFNTENMTRVQAWNYMKSLPSGPVKFIFL